MGIAADAISFKTVTMNNFDTIIVNNTNELIIINTATRQFENFTATVESAIMNPKARVMGLRGNINWGLLVPQNVKVLTKGYMKISFFQLLRRVGEHIYKYTT